MITVLLFCMLVEIKQLYFIPTARVDIIVNQNTGLHEVYTATSVTKSNKCNYTNMELSYYGNLVDGNNWYYGTRIWILV